MCVSDRPVVQPSTLAGCSVAEDSVVMEAAVTVVQTDPILSNPPQKNCSKRCCVLIAFLSLLSVIGVVVVALAAMGKLGNSNNDSSTITGATQPLSEEEYQERYANFRAIMMGYTNPSAFSDPNTPQSKALTWLVYKDTTVPGDDSGERLLQRYALMVIFYACSGEDWLGFLTPLDAQSDISECLFHGVTCNDEGRVTTLQWSSNRMVGQIPDEIGLLSSLITLDFSDNMLKGAIPKAIPTKLTNLKNLYLDYNEFTSTIGSEFANLAKLEELQLDNNYLTGPLPTALTTLNLRVVGLSGNQLTGPILDMLPWWKNLEFFMTDQSTFSGTIPDAIGDLTNLRTFSISQTAISGTIPESFAKLTNLQALYIDCPKLADTFPSFFGTLTKLTTLTFVDTIGDGTLPSIIGLLTNLEKLIVDDNSMGGTLPSELGNLVRLEYLSISGNRFTGTMPLGLANATNLAYADLTYNGAMSGPVDHLCFVEDPIYWDCDFKCGCCQRECN